MTFLPIVARELRVAARRRSTWWLRLGGALATLFVASFFFLTMGLRGSAAGMGGPLFATLSGLCFFVTLMAGLFFTSDCLSEEKRDGTLGLLFLTDLRGFDVVLGKLMATSLRAAYALLAAFPILATALLAGGVTGAYFWKVILSLLNTLFFSLAVGVLVSSVSRDHQRAMAGTLGLILLATLGLPLLDWLWGVFAGSGNQNLLKLASPAYAFGASNGRDASFWYATAVVHALAWLCLALAGQRAARTWQESASARKASPARSAGSSWRYGSTGQRDDRRRTMLARNPAYWLAARERWQGLALHLFTLFMLVVLGIILALFEVDMGGIVASYVICHVLVLGLYPWVASQAARFFIENWRSGALELLLASPLSGQEIIAGQWVALRRIFLVPVATLLLVRLGLGLWQFGLLGVKAGFVGAGAMGWSSLRLQTILDAAMSSTGLLATAWVGMWLGLRLRRANLAVGLTLILVLVIPVFGYQLLHVFLAIPVLTGGVPSWAVTFFMSLLWIFKDVVFIGWARRRLHKDFRETAARTVLPAVKGGGLPAAPGSSPAPPIFPAVPPR